MLETSARRAPSPAVRVPAALAMTVLVASLLVGCASKEAAAPRSSPTPLKALDTTTMEVPRIEFCTLVPGSAVRAALGGKPDSSTSYRNGDEVDLPDVGREVVHEIGCTWSTDDGAAARAWVFARPVDGAFARQAIDSSKETAGCRMAPGPAYGDPTLTQVCRERDGTTRVRHAGLFGQTWLTCEVADPGAGGAEVRPRADAWCVEVVNALNTHS